MSRKRLANDMDKFPWMKKANRSMGHQSKYGFGEDKRGANNMNSDWEESKKTSDISYADNNHSSDDEALEELVFGGSRKKETESEEKPLFFIDKGIEKSDASCSGAAWIDEDDEDGTEGTHDQPVRSRGMGNMKYQQMRTGDRKAEFEKIVGEAPAWTKIPEKSNSDEDALLTSNFNYITKSESLSKGILEFQRCTDVNKEQTSYRLEACEFHKTAQISLTAGQDCRLNLFQVDGKLNSKLHSLFTEKFPIHCAHFLESGKEIIITSNVRYFYSYDLIAGKIAKFPFIKGTADRMTNRYYVSPDGKHLIFNSTHGHMHLVSARTKELVKTVKVNGWVHDVAFRKNGQEFLAYGEEGVVTIWDIRTTGCYHSFVNDGCTEGHGLAVSPNGKYVACGSRSGIVNIYDESCMKSGNPTPVKALKNLKHSTYSLQFNSTSEMLGMSSAECDNAVKLVHVPSMTVFSNFPGMQNKYLRRVFRLDFSPNSGYLMLGNMSGRAFLYRMQHYKSY